MKKEVHGTPSQGVAPLVLLLLAAMAGAAALGACAPAPAYAPSPRPYLALRGLPAHASGYHPDVAALHKAGVPTAFGQEEWDAIVLTQEVHGHTGIYTILGAKMGIRAWEVLNAPLRAIHAKAETGSAQPLACLLDGIQVSIGSTFGQNLISLADGVPPAAAATFSYQDKAVRIALKPEYSEEIRGFIQEFIAAHGNLTEAYFAAVEAKSYDIWKTYDRKEIFAVEEVPAPGA